MKTLWHWAVLILGVILVLWLNSCLGASVDLWWNPVQDPDCAGYVLYWGPAGQVSTNRWDVGNVTNACNVPVEVSRPYWFYLTAYDQRTNESDPSPVLIYTYPNLVRVTVSCSTDPTGTNWQTIFTETALSTNASWFYKVRIENLFQ